MKRGQLREALEDIERAISECRGDPPSGHRHWHPFPSREAWLRHKHKDAYAREALRQEGYSEEQIEEALTQ